MVRSDHGEAHCGSSGSFIGREAELAALAAAAATAPSLVVIQGEPGIGKSKLVAEFLKRSERGARQILIGRCHPGASDFVLGPVVAALADVAGCFQRDPLPPITGVLRALLPELAADLPPPPAPVAPGAERHRQFRALRDLLSELGPAVCVLEDLHWADDMTLDFLSFLARHLPPELTLVVTYRKEGLKRAPSLGTLPSAAQGSSQLLVLKPMNADEVRLFVASLLDASEVAEEFAGFLHDKTSGLPFAVEEVIRLLQQRKDLPLNQPLHWTGRTLPHLEVPPVLADSILERMQRLSSAGQAVVRAVAVLGRSANQSSIRQIAGTDAARTHRGILDALSAALLREEGEQRYELRHALARQAVYEAIPGPLRRQLHTRAAAALAGESSGHAVFAAAHHFKKAGKAANWVAAAMKAADWALAVGNYDSAARVLESAAASTDLSPALRGRAAAKLGTAALLASRYSPALEILDEMLKDEGLPRGVRGEVRLRLAELLVIVGAGAAARQELVQATKDLRRQPALASHTMCDLAMPLSVAGTMREHERWLKNALELADRTSDSVAMAFAEATSVLVPLFAGAQGAWSQATSHNLAELPLMYQAGFRLQMANACLLVGHAARAETLIEQVCQMKEVLEPPHISSSSQVLRLLGDYHTGRWSELEARAAAVTAVMDGNQLELLPVRLATAEVALARGDLHSSEEVFRTVLELARAAGWLPMVIRAAAGLARAAFSAGDAPRASEVADSALLNMRDKGLWVWGSDLVAVAVEARLALGGPDLAGAIVDEFDAAVRDLDAPAALASLTWCRGLLRLEAGDEETAASLFNEAGSLWGAISCPLGVGRARREAGRALLKLEPDKAVAVLLEALRIFENVGAEAEAASVRALFRGRGIPIGRRGGRKAYGDELSPRELQVASLVATGSSNREIAAALFISVRTVEEHVGRVLKKRGLESRVDLIRELAVEKQKPVLLRVDGPNR